MPPENALGPPLTLSAYISMRQSVFRSGHYGMREVSPSPSGGVLGLLGRNRAGKSMRMQMLATVTRPTRNELRRT